MSENETAFAAGIARRENIKINTASLVPTPENEIGSISTSVENGSINRSIKNLISIPSESAIKYVEINEIIQEINVKNESENITDKF